MPMRTLWVVRSHQRGFLVDTCVGGKFTGPEVLKWSAMRIIDMALSWSNMFDALHAMNDAEIARSDDVDVFPIDV